MKTYLTLSAIALAAAATLSSGAVMAADPAPTPEFTIAYNIGATSDYRVRGIKQNNSNPAVQGGIDIGHSSGLYVGTWASNVSDWTAAGSKRNLEIDYYGGYKTEVAGVALDFGTIYYSYPGLTGTNLANTHEAYVGATYGPAAFKVSRVLSDNYFAAASATESAKGTMYYDVTLSQEVAPKLTVALHAGYTDFKDTGTYNSTNKFSYADYNLGLTYDYEGYLLGIKYYVNDAKAGTKTYATSTTTATTGNLVKSGVAVSILKAF